MLCHRHPVFHWFLYFVLGVWCWEYPDPGRWGIVNGTHFLHLLCIILISVLASGMVGLIIFRTETIWTTKNSSHYLRDPHCWLKNISRRCLFNTLKKNFFSTGVWYDVTCSLVQMFNQSFNWLNLFHSAYLAEMFQFPCWLFICSGEHVYITNLW